MVAFPHRKGGAADDGAAVAAAKVAEQLIPVGIIGEKHPAVGVRDKDGFVGALCRGKLQIDGDLPAVALRPVHRRAGSDDGAAVDIGAAVAVQPGIGGGIGRGQHGAAVNDEITIGIDAVALRAEAGHDIDDTPVDCGDRNAVLIGIDAVVARTDIDDAAVDGQMQLAVKPLVLGLNIENAGAGLAAGNLHRHPGIECPVVLVALFLLRLILIDAGDIGALDVIDGVVGYNDARPGSRGIVRG